MWKRLTHPNIVPLLGITLTPLQLVSEWVSGGTLPNYISRHPDADRVELVGVHPVVFIPSLPLSPAIWHRQGPLLSSLLQCDSWRPEGSMLLS